MNSELKTKGTVERIIQYRDGTIEKCNVENTVLISGQQALIAGLAGQYGNYYNYFISNMVFGNGGTDGSNKPYIVPITQNKLFCGTPLSSKAVMSTIDSNIPTQLVCSTFLTWSDCAGYSINEMALVMNSGDFYSMTTFAPLSKTSNMQITWNWRISFI